MGALEQLGIQELLESVQLYRERWLYHAQALRGAPHIPFLVQCQERTAQFQGNSLWLGIGLREHWFGHDRRSERFRVLLAYLGAESKTVFTGDRDGWIEVAFFEQSAFEMLGHQARIQLGCGNEKVEISAHAAIGQDLLLILAKAVD